MACNYRLFLFTTCSLQLISTIERQVFDLLGYQWLPIAANFLHIVFVIIGFFGGYQYRKSYLITYTVWLCLWLAWNAFIICFYLNIGVLTNNSELLNLGTGAASWWEVNGIGCKPYFSVNGSQASPINLELADVLRPPRPDWVEGCLLGYVYVEVIHAAVQLILALIGLLSVVLILRHYKTDDDGYAPKPRSRAQSLYSVQYSTTTPRGRSSPLDDELELTENGATGGATGSSDPNKPMTPRRVKRRSGTRSSGRHSRSSQRGRNGPNQTGMVNEAYSNGTIGSRSGTLTSVSSQHRNGRESLRKKRYTNPVNRLMDESSTSNDSMPALPAYFPSSHPNGGFPMHQPPPPPPVHRNRAPPTSRAPAVLPAHQQQQQHHQYPQPQQHPPGHSNPLYVSSRPNSVYSISANVENDYRPPSAHSSYSNWHGHRPLPNANGNGNLHGHSPTPSTATTAFETATTTNTFGVPDHRSASAASGPIAGPSGYSRPPSQSHYNNYGVASHNHNGRGQGHY